MNVGGADFSLVLRFDFGGRFSLEFTSEVDFFICARASAPDEVVAFAGFVEGAGGDLFFTVVDVDVDFSFDVVGADELPLDAETSFWADGKDRTANGVKVIEPLKADGGLDVAELSEVDLGG